MKKIWCFLLLAVALTGCLDTEEESGPSLTGSWMLSFPESSLGGATQLTAPAGCASLVLTNEEEPEESSKLWGYKMAGELPVNSYVGNYQFKKGSSTKGVGSLAFVNLGMTEVGGSTPTLQFEQAYLSALRAVNSFEVKSDKLVLRSAQGHVKLVFVRGASSCGEW